MRKSLAFRLFCAHFCARHRILSATGYGPLAATYAWRHMSEARRAPWQAVAETAVARAEEHAAERAAQARDHLLGFLRVRRLAYSGRLRQDLDTLITEAEAEASGADFEEA